MNNENIDEKIIDFESRKEAIENKEAIDNGTKTLDYLTLEQIEDVGELYKLEIRTLAEEIKKLEEENKRLKSKYNL